MGKRYLKGICWNNRFQCKKYEKFIDMVSYSTQQLIFKKTLNFQVLCSKEKHPQLSEKTMKILLFFPIKYLSEARFSSYTLTKIT